MKTQEEYNKVFYYSIIFFFIGIFINSTFKDFNIYPIIFVSSISFIIFIFLKLNFKKSLALNIFLFSSIFFIFGFLHSDIYQSNLKPEHDNLLNSKINQNFVVDDEPENKDFHTKLILKFKNSDDRIISWIPNLPKYSYGDELNISGWLLPIKNFKTDRNNNFDYINFLKKDNIFYEIKNPKITFIKHNQGNPIKEKLFIFKTKIIEQIKQIMPEPESSLLAGILIGAKEDMGQKLLDDFRKTGIIHIVVLSGFNLTIVAYFIMLILSVFGRRISTIFGSISIISFAIMTGASATVVRASLMALLVILAKSLGRNTEALKLLFFAGFLMLLFNPMLLLYDASFQLSFLATLGLLLLSPYFEKIIKYGKFSKAINFREILAATLSTQIFVFPLLLYMMGEISIIAPVVNIIVLILIPQLMIFSILILIISILWFELAHILAYIVYLILHLDLEVINFFANFKYATLKFESFSAINMLSVYLIYFLIFILWNFKKRKKEN